MSEGPPDAAAPPGSPAAPSSGRRTGWRRWSALAAVVLLGALAVVGVMQRQAEREAREQAAQQRAAVAWAQDLRDWRESVAAPARATNEAATSLAFVLEEHLTDTERADATIAEDRGRLEESLRDAGDALRGTLVSGPPPPGGTIAADVAQAVLEDLAVVEAEAQALAAQVDQTVMRTQRWSEAVLTVRQRARAYADAVTGLPDTSDPARLRELWEAERQPLHAYREAAQQARQIPGLEPWADAHLGYVEANLDWVDRAVSLLADEDLDAYNQQLEQTFAGSDPFGFQLAVARATPAALHSPAIESTELLLRRSISVLEQVEVLRRTALRELSR